MPTASLSADECRKLFAIIRDLSASNVAVLYVTHRLDEILELCGRVTVFRDGQSVAELAGADITRRALVAAIVGGQVETLEKSRYDATRGDVVLSVRGMRRLPRVAGSLTRWPNRVARRQGTVRRTAPTTRTRSSS